MNSKPEQAVWTYAIGDIDGRFDLLKSLLSAIRDDTEQHVEPPRIIFLGDITDHGPDSRLAMELVCQTLEEWPASRLILGNHDSLLLEFMTADVIDVPRFDYWLQRQGGLATLLSYGLEDFDSHDTMATYFRDAYRVHLGVLMSAEHILFDRQYAYVHAGVDPSLPLDEQEPRDLMWIREQFLQFDGPLSHVVVHGHSPNKQFVPEIKSNRIGIDTWAFRSGKLSCLAVSPDQDHLRIISACLDGISIVVGVNGPAAALECT
jgi:serine/threonine protein phosphatase 1